MKVARANRIPALKARIAARIRGLPGHEDEKKTLREPGG
jgi:hypothetical protein